MLKLEDFKKFEVKNSKVITGGHYTTLNGVLNADYLAGDGYTMHDSGTNDLIGCRCDNGSYSMECCRH